MAELVRAVPAVQGLIVGDGQEGESLRTKVRSRMGLTEVVRFLGYRRDMHRIYPAVDVVALPSLSEGLPMVALEAMAHARPVVGTRVGGIPEVVEHGVSGLARPTADPGALAREIASTPSAIRCAAVDGEGRARADRAPVSVRARGADSGGVRGSPAARDRRSGREG